MTLATFKMHLKCISLVYFYLTEFYKTTLVSLYCFFLFIQKGFYPSEYNYLFKLSFFCSFQPNFKDYPVYLVKFKQCLSKAMHLMKTYTVNTLQNLTSQLIKRVSWAVTWLGFRFWSNCRLNRRTCSFVLPIDLTDVFLTVKSQDINATLPCRKTIILVVWPI